MLRLQGVSKSWPHGDRPLLRNVSFNVADGELVYLVGPNGSGKSTLLSIISGHQQLDAGQVFVDGVDVTHVSARVRSKSIALVPQDPLKHLLPDATILENVLLAKNGTDDKLPFLFPKIRRRSGVHSQLREWDLKLAGRLDDRVEPLSGGEKQVLGIVMMCIRRPRVLLLDEPTASLDTRVEERFLSVVQDVRHRWRPAIIVVTHRLDRVLDGKERLVILGPTGAIDLPAGHASRNTAGLKEFIG